MEIVSLSMKQVRQAADNFLRDYNPNNQLPVDIEKIAELDLKIFLCVIPGIKNLIGIDGFINSDFSQITVDDSCYNKFHERTRFTIAHEIGHKILHQSWYEKNGPKDFKSFQEFSPKISEKDYRYMEIQAQTFAGLVLVPTELLKKEIFERLGKLPEKEDVEILQSIIFDLVGIFEVSSDVIYRRMVTEGLIKKIN
jgi:hypothetical protein